MADALLQKWKSLAQRDESYVGGKTYAVILSALEELLEARGNLSIDLKGNRPKLKENRLVDKDVAVLCSALEELINEFNLVVLDLSYNLLTEQAMFYVASYLKTQGCRLRSLRLSYNDIGTEGVEHLCHALLVNTTLREIDLEGCKMGVKGGLQLASSMQVNTAIRSLKVGSADLEVDSVVAMATILHGNDTLQVLDLSRPLLFSHQEETARHLSNAMKVNSALCELHLSKHGMTDTGLEWLCKALKENTSLTLLNISSNKFSRDGARHLAGLLHINPPMKELILSFNRIEDEGLVWISQAITTDNINLERLNVDYNSIGDVGLCALAKALRSNSSLHFLTIWGNNIQRLTCEAFSELLDTGRLDPANVDVMAYEVDQQMYLARTQHTHPM